MLRKYFYLTLHSTPYVNSDCINSDCINAYFYLLIYLFLLFSVGNGSSDNRWSYYENRENPLIYTYSNAFVYIHLCFFRYNIMHFMKRVLTCATIIFSITRIIYLKKENQQSRLIYNYYDILPLFRISVLQFL